MQETRPICMQHLHCRRPPEHFRSQRREDKRVRQDYSAYRTDFTWWGMGNPFWKMCPHLLVKIFWSNFCRRTSHPLKRDPLNHGQVINARFQPNSRSFVVSFFNQRYPQTKTNITERNFDGLIDGTKSRSRWDFVAFKDFIFLTA